MLSLVTNPILELKNDAFSIPTSVYVHIVSLCFVCIDKEGDRGMSAAGTRRPFSSLFQLNLSTDL